MTEVEFFHHPSRTLVLTDFIENFEPGKLGSWWMRWLTRLGGVQDPHGPMPRDMRSTFVRQRLQPKAAVERLLAWEPERIVPAHGPWHARDGTAELRRPLDLLLHQQTRHPLGLAATTCAYPPSPPTPRGPNT